MPFANRLQAAAVLAQRLDTYRGRRALVVAIPRGAVPMARLIADALAGDLDVVLVRKLGSPENPELAIGSIDEAGSVYLDPELQDLWTAGYLEREKHAQLEKLAQRRAMYGAQAIDPAGRVVIVVDDGIATGSTMIAALRAIRARHPAKLIAATAVAPVETVRRLRNEADEVVCLETPSPFFAIGLHFDDFSQVSDEEVVRHLTETRQTRTVAAAH